MITPTSDPQQPTERPTGEASSATGEASPSWWAHARCNDNTGRLTRLFFSDELVEIARAKHICATCPAIIPCLSGALDRREPSGVWGGQLFASGRIVRVKRSRGRPPKQPRPQDQLPDVPIPAQLREEAAQRSA